MAEDSNVAVLRAISNRRRKKFRIDRKLKLWGLAYEILQNKQILILILNGNNARYRIRKSIYVLFYKNCCYQMAEASNCLYILRKCWRISLEVLTEFASQLYLGTYCLPCTRWLMPSMFVYPCLPLGFRGGIRTDKNYRDFVMLKTPHHSARYLN